MSFREKIHQIFSHTLDLTEDNFWKNIPLYTIPMVLLSLLQLLYSSADQIIVANFGGGYVSFNAIGSNTALINLIIGVFVGIGVGANVVIAKAKGKGNVEKAHKTIQSSIVIALICGVFLAGVGYVLAPVLLKVLDTPSLYIEKATWYLRIYFFGMPALMVFNFGSALLRGLGDSKRPLYALGACGIFNIGLNFLFVCAFGLDVVGVGIATIICEVMQAVLILYFLAKKDNFASFSWKEWALYGPETKEILHHGVPAGLQAAIFSFSNIFIQKGVNGFEDPSTGLTSDIAVAGNTASVQIEHYIWNCMNAFAVAVAAIVSQNYGAHKKKNLMKIFWVSIFYETIVGVSLGVISFFLRYQLIGLFLSKESFTFDGVFMQEAFNKAMAIGTMRLTIVGLTYVLDGYMDVCSYYIRGLGHSKTPTIVTFTCITLFRIVFVVFIWRNVPFFNTLIWLYVIWPISWTITIIVYSFIIPSFNKKAYDHIDRHSVPSENA